MKRKLKKKPKSTTPEQAICAVGFGSRYTQGILRLHRSLNDVGYKGGRFFWQNELPPGSPSHQEAPYGFKARAMDYARQAGARHILWCDTSIVALKSLDPLFKVLSERAILTFQSGWALGTWCSDNVLPCLELEREESMKISMIAATSYGLNLDYEDAHYTIDMMLEYEKAGALFGPWLRRDGYVSADERVLGHRHDQTCLSAIFHKLGVKQETMPYLFSVHPDAVDDTTCLLAKGV